MYKGPEIFADMFFADVLFFVVRDLTVYTGVVPDAITENIVRKQIIKTIYSVQFRFIYSSP